MSNIDWRSVPLDYKEKWDNIFNSNTEGVNLSQSCPICNTKTLHRYYYLEKRINTIEYKGKGSEWQWCSFCKIYEHANTFVPNWWSCNIFIDGLKLTPIPNIIDIALKDSYKINKWIELPDNFYEIWENIFFENKNNFKINFNCINCGNNSLYQYYTCDNINIKYQKKLHKGKGSNWRWCSSCFNYTYDYLTYVPFEWSCLSELELLIKDADLMVIPEEINEIYKIYDI